MQVKGTWVTRTTGVLIVVLGLPMIWFGADLAFVGGTPYYLCTGILLAISGVELFRAQRRGFYLFAAALLLTLAWAVYEAGIEFWLVGSRIWLIGLISLWLCTPFIRRPLWGEDMSRLLTLRTVRVCALASVAVLGAMTYNLLSSSALPGTYEISSPPQNPSDWQAYGGNSAGTRYAPHEQINKTNVSKLKPVWQADTGRVGRFSATPIQIDDGLYLCTSQNVMIALDVDSGVERWRFDPKNETPAFGILGNCRGVTYYHIPDLPKGEHCAERIYTATTDARMIAVDKASGHPCEEFGDAGQISLLAGMGEVKPYFYFVTSPPTVASRTLVVGGWVADNQETQEPSGVVRGYDPRTGALLWAWDIGREGMTVLPPDGGFYTRGTPNVWSLTSADDELGLVYVPTGNATPDYFGGQRTEVMDKFSSSIVAIDAKTGLTRWHFQTTHHDIWDYDVPSQPTLVDLTLEGVKRKAVIVPTKRGELFMLDRETGELLTEVTERPVPQTDLPDERTSATQPFSTGMPSFAHPHIRERDLFGITPFDQMACRKTFHSLRYEGPMTPPSVKGTMLYPGPAGGMNWGSVAVDEERALMVVNNMHLPWIIHMIPREEDLLASNEGLSRGYGIGGPQRGTPFAARVQMFASPFFLPCLKPPYGEIAVVDLTTQKIVWRRGMGPLSLGLPYSAGSIITAGGLIFNAGVMDGQLRAIDSLTGEVIWQDPLRGASDATPMTYVSPKTQRQYVIVTVPGQAPPQGTPDHDTSGEGEPAPPTGGRVIAYALPEGE
ncbi:MAG: PQQ-binding-like beta-propeller repeat protein [Proteobacteria bacterium]|nr:PQQ-binding-like beta-propeller repeat protein [Pseudomonadota bacterium]